VLEAIDRILRIIGFEKDDYIAIPLSEFARMEEFRRSDMERSGLLDVIIILPRKYVSDLPLRCPSCM
jgi:hypothetical protein